MPPCAYFTPSACVSASTSSISKPSVESALKSYNAVSEKYLSAVATMSSLHTLSPANMITPSATIENIARYLPRLCLISRSEVFFIADFISYTPSLPLNILHRNNVFILNHGRYCSILHGYHPVRHGSESAVMSYDHHRFAVPAAGILQKL